MAIVNALLAFVTLCVCVVGFLRWDSPLVNFVLFRGAVLCVLTNMCNRGTEQVHRAQKLPSCPFVADSSSVPSPCVTDLFSPIPALLFQNGIEMGSGTVWLLNLATFTEARARLSFVQTGAYIRSPFLFLAGDCPTVSLYQLVDSFTSARTVACLQSLALLNNAITNNHV